MTVEHVDRGPLSMDELAQVIARDIPAGSFVNLGIGQPTKIADHLTGIRWYADQVGRLPR